MKFFPLLAIALLNLTVNVYAQGQNLVAGTYEHFTGDRKYLLYFPKKLSNTKIPLVIMLHGCDQTAEQFFISSKIKDEADKFNFAVLLPEQEIFHNPFKCWNWIIPANNSRLGESEMIVSMYLELGKTYPINTDKVFAVGMSAGASMAQILGNCYPEKIKAVASHDGVQFLPTLVWADFATVVLNGATVPPEQAGYYGHLCSLMHNPPKKMPIIIFQGLASPLMNPMHAFQVEDEFKVFNDYLDNGRRDFSIFKDKVIETVPDSDRYGFTKYSFKAKNDEIFIERYMINRLNHAWSGGDGRYKYNDPKGPSATKLIINFFKRFGL